MEGLFSIIHMTALVIIDLSFLNCNFVQYTEMMKYQLNQVTFVCTALAVVSFTTNNIVMFGLIFKQTSRDIIVVYQVGGTVIESFH